MHLGLQIEQASHPKVLPGSVNYTFIDFLITSIVPKNNHTGTSLTTPHSLPLEIPI